MGDTTKRFCWVSVYAIAMAFLEAAVVAYIRALIQVTADHVDLGPYLAMEVGREAATIVMLVTVGWIAGRRRLERWAYGLFAFGLWDVFYYLWLKVLLAWPTTLLDWDILFLIPLRWWGPVLSPMLIAALICVSAVLAVHMLREGQYSVALLPLALLGATLGFLPWNFYPAKVFLGSGSLVLGYTIATLGIAAGAKLALLLLVLSIPIIDVAWLMIMRLRAGQSIGQADRRHLHYRLLDLGLSQRQVVLLYYAYCITLGAAALLIDSRMLKLGTLIVLGMATLGFLAWLAQRTVGDRS